MNGNLIVGIVVIIVVPVILLFLAIRTQYFFTFSWISIVIGLFLLGLPLGIVSLYCTRKWYKNLREKDKTTGDKIGYILSMIVGVLIVIFGSVALILTLIFY